MGDLLDPPARRTEREDVADARLVDHLLVELADAVAGRPGLADHEDAEEAAVGDRATARHGEPLSAGAAGERVRVAIPDEARPQLGELVGGVAAREQVEGRLVGRAGQRDEGGAAADGVEPLVDVEHLERGGGDGLLREDVERVGRHRDRLDQAGAHPLGGDGRVHQVGPVLGVERAARDLADLVAGAADALQAARDRRRGLDLDDEVDGAHVDAELEARGRDDAAQPARLEVVLDDRALLLAH